MFSDASCTARTSNNTYMTNSCVVGRFVIDCDVAFYIAQASSATSFAASLVLLLGVILVMI
jgi:hypothetical protein